MDEKQEKRFKSLKLVAIVLLVIVVIMCIFAFKQAADYSAKYQEQQSSGSYNPFSRIDESLTKVQPVQLLGYLLQFALLIGIIIGCMNQKSYSAILAIITGILFIISLDIISIFVGLALILDGYYILKNGR